MSVKRRLTDLFHIELPILLAPMAGAMDVALAIEVAKAGGLGSLPAAMLSADQLRAQVAAFRAAVDAPINLNFFAHTPPVPNNAREHAWREALKPYYAAYGIDPNAPVPTSNRAPFDDAFCAVVEEVKPGVVSFHFGLPEPSLVERGKAAGCTVIASATTVAEARWLEERGCDAIIAQGYEAGGHRGIFLTDDLATQVGTFALVPQVADAVKVPVIAAGGITDARGIVAALALGADGVQIGTAYLPSPESKILPPHRALLKAKTEETAVTNVMTGRPARGFINRVMRELGPISDLSPAFPLAGGALAPLHAKAQAQGSGDFSSMWAGQAAALAREMPAADLTRTLWSEAQALMARMAAR
ncbi:nitronate monooxygenase [Pseudolabrys taiwanensis]|uniref:Nitronate monooxygenase n=1 Tax=Pseudolabrys taiwanensis TaxID=331696 RepID=A0A345ZS77_9HYPH|nr:nitronate monooxygenase family protein [Pseudolabrys taiwanensis]AXK79774.1 nitronate monooxygenase [Pseudolabrys taiwanensis]